MRHEVTAALLLAVGLCVSSIAHGQVYKCTGSGGATVYSQQPCGPNAAVVETRKGPNVDAAAAETANRKAMGRTVDTNNAGYAEAACLRDAGARTWGPADERIGEYQRQISALTRDIGRANNNAAGAAWESGLRTQIAGLEQAIATERSSAATRMDGERARCAAQRDRAVQEVERRYRDEVEASKE